HGHRLARAPFFFVGPTPKPPFDLRSGRSRTRSGGALTRATFAVMASRHATTDPARGLVPTPPLARVRSERPPLPRGYSVRRRIPNRSSLQFSKSASASKRGRKATRRVLTSEDAVRRQPGYAARDA